MYCFGRRRERPLARYVLERTDPIGWSPRPLIEARASVAAGLQKPKNVLGRIARRVQIWVTV